MSDRAEPQLTALSRALWTLANLVMAQRVTHASVWHSVRLLTEQVVRIDVTGYPLERDELLAAMPEVTPEDWQGDTGQSYREWRGSLLTMNVTVQETLTSADEPAAEPAERPEPLPDWFGNDRGTVLPIGPGLSGPGGPLPEQRYPLDVPADHLEQSRLTTEDDEQEFFAVADGLQPPPSRGEQVAALLAGMREIVDSATAGHSTSDLAARYAGVPGVVVIAGDEPDREAQDHWARYARALCLEELRAGDRAYATVEDATAAIEAWAGRDMLELSDVERCAHELVAAIPPAVPIGSAAGRRRFGIFRRKHSIGAL